jgi:acetyltransferase-like isoleucine patch superfamily enzyme
VIENLYSLRVAAWVLSFLRWRLLGLRTAAAGREMPRIWRGARILNPRRVSLGRCTQLRPFAIVRGVPGLVEIGDHTGVGSFAIVNAVESVTIGARVMIAPGCHITDANHDVAGTGAMQALPRRADPVVIEDDVWLGANSVVTAGVRIGRGAVVGAGAVVTRSVEPLAIVAGVPARPIGRRAPEELSAGSAAVPAGARQGVG